jgi:hypothetical protein
MKNIWLALLVLVLISVVGCNKDTNLSKNAEIAKTFLEGKGYKVNAFLNESSSELTEKWVNSFPGKQEWRVQPVSPDEFIGEEIQRIQFEVENHPLNDRYDEVIVTVFLYKEEVIGGLSSPGESDIDGAPYSLEGN